MFQRRYGLHFDFHAKPFEGMPAIGETLSEDDIREICRRVKPEFIQIDCKGHPGYASYPTRLGNAMPMICKDTLSLWRRVTKEEGVKLFMHYSGVMDERFCQEHPECAVLRLDGTRSPNVTRTFGHRYADMLLIPQLLELAGVYGVDGVWVDGECWATEVDYDPETVSAFENETGLILKGHEGDLDSAEMQAFRAYCRKLFMDYVQYYTDKVHAVYPDFMITSNWLYSDYMPEKVCVDVDYLSGDFNPWNSVCSARVAGRALAGQGKGWDLMSWNFRVNREGYAAGVYVKSPQQIMQEAASVLSLGGGFQNYITQRKDGSPRMEQIRPMEQVFDFVRARVPWCYGCEAVPQVAVFMSAHDRYLECKGLFGRDGGERIMGLVALLCDMGHSVSVVSEHSFEKGYPLIVVPELYRELEAGTAKQLLRYAREGGSLLLIGPNTIACMIRAGAPLTMENCTQERQVFSLDGEGFASVYGSSCAVEAQGAEVLARRYGEEREAGQPFALCLKYGKGMLSCVGADIGLAYQEARQSAHPKLLARVMARLYQPLARIESAEGTVELTLLHRDNALLLQLTNMNGPHHDTRTPSFSNIWPCRDVRLALRLKAKPRAVTQRPCGKAVDFKWEGDTLRFTIDRVDYHEIVEIETGAPE